MDAWISALVTDAQKKKLECMARQTDRSRSAMLRQLIEAAEIVEADVEVKVAK